MPTELATGYVSIVADTRNVPDQMKRAFESAGDAAGRSGGEAAGGGMLDSLKGMGAAGVAGALGAAFVGAGVLVAKTFWSSLENGMAQQKTLNVTAAKIGADDATMAKIGRAAADAYVGAFGESVEDNIAAAGAAFSAGLFDSDATQRDISQLTKQLQGVSTVLDADVSESIKATSVLLKAGLADDAEHAINIIATAAQKGANFGEDLLENIWEYSSGWKQAGINAETALALIAESGKLGADVGDRAADALREFGRRMTEEGETIEETLGELEELGGLIDPSKIFEDLGKGGEEGAAAFDAMFDAVRRVEDPIKQTQIVAALLGDTSGDFINVFRQWDPSDAVAKFGQTADAAQGLVDKLGAGGANSLDSARRSIEVSTDQISLALANAFGPELAKVADWVSNHQPEILGFLGAVADAVLWGTEALMGMAYWALRAGEMIVTGIGEGIGKVTGPLGAMASAIGEMTGSEKLQSLGSSLSDVRGQLVGAGEAMGTMADWIEDKGMPKLGDLRASVSENVAVMKDHAAVTRALGEEVLLIPSDKEILIRSNTPEQRAALEALGLQLVELDDQPGTFKVVGNTAEGQAMIDNFISTNNGKKVGMQVTADTTPAQAAVNQFVTENTNRRAVNVGVNAQILGVTPNASGTDRHGIPRLSGGGSAGRTAAGVLWGPGTGTSDSILGIGADGWPTALVSTGEGVVKESAMSNGGGELVEALNAGWVPPIDLLRAMLPGLAGGGSVPGKAFAVSMDPTPYGMGGFSRQSIDCSALVSAVINDAMGIEPFSDRMTTSNAASWLAARGGVSGIGGPGDISVGWYDHGGGAAGHMGMTLGDGTAVESRSGDGVVVGGDAHDAGDPMFEQAMHIPAKMLLGGDSGSGGTGALGAGTSAGGGASGGGASGGGTGGAAGGSSAGSVTIGGVEIPSGVTPVWVVGTSASSTTTASDTSTVAPDASTGGSGTTTSSSSDVQTLQEAWNTGISRFTSVGETALNGQFDDILGTVGLSRTGGAVQTLVSTLYDKIVAAIQSEISKNNISTSSAISQYGGSR